MAEAELEDAVVGDRQRAEERQPPRPAVRRVDPGRLRPGQLPEDPGGGEELEARRADRGGREAGLQMDRVAEEEPEVALRARARGSPGCRRSATTRAKTTTGTATQRQPRCAGGEVAAGTAEAATAVSNRTSGRMTKARLVRLAARARHDRSRPAARPHLLRRPAHPPRGHGRAAAVCGSTRSRGSSRTSRSTTCRRPAGACPSTSGSCAASGSTCSGRSSTTARSS